ncbi:bifunctional GNAT family N-acetyltransferase/NUDIX hydrolase [Streptomyces abyssomicinicus]|uniref:bifunctional GNAT family N-acetyltransferase/NUDIX hydrolase n=1 Tax=Streptomyces abyssomicinicus TaxID=574929 RepID=UPI0012502E73|nr:bifunctional GNAT family N-acetyltransferase/NUDIX hydrolase [Streptomyces abyssomicinicus]
MILEPLTLTPDRDIPGPVLTELTALYASNREFHALSGGDEFPDPDDIRPEQVAAALAEELADPDIEVLLARSSGRLVGLAVTLAHHPDPADPDPWIGLLMVDASVHRQGFGRRLVAAVEARLFAGGRTAVRLAVLDSTPDSLAFWTALGYQVIGHRVDRQYHRPCSVLRKPLQDPRTPRMPRAAARVAVVGPDPDRAVLLLRYENPGTGAYWALPGGGLEPGESPLQGATREVREETGWSDVTPGPLLCVWEHDFPYRGVPVRQHEHVYLARAPLRDLAGDLTEAHADDAILAWRWWSLEELAATEETIWPPRLAMLVAAATATDRPASP